jgi:segregation and condensation protein A
MEEEEKKENLSTSRWDAGAGKNPQEVLPVKQDQIHDLLFSRELGWQEIIYDLINTEQLDAWDIDILVLSDKYLEKVRQIEEADFFISSKVLLATSLFLKIKSEVLLNQYIKSIDEILFGKPEKPKYELERIELEEEIPELVLRSPIPRFKKVTLNELIESLNKAISTENRRIQKISINNNAIRRGSFSIPKRKFSTKDKMKELYKKLFAHLEYEEKKKRISFKELVGESKEEKIISLLPLLHLENQKKIWMHQEVHFEEIHIWLKDVFLKHNPDPFAELKEEIEEEIKSLDKKRVKKVNENFDDPIGGI